MMLHGLYAYLTYYQALEILNQLISPKVLCDMYASARNDEETRIVLAMLFHVVLYTRVQEDRELASQFLRELGVSRTDIRLVTSIDVQTQRYPTVPQYVRPFAPAHIEAPWWLPD